MSDIESGSEVEKAGTSVKGSSAPDVVVSDNDSDIVIHDDGTRTIHNVDGTTVIDDDNNVIDITNDPTTWIFQSLPKNFDPRNSRIGQIEKWGVYRYFRHIRVDDLVFFWLGQEHQGIYAWGRISTEPRKNPDDEKQFLFEVTIEGKLLFPIPRNMVFEILNSTHPLVKVRAGSIFPCSKDQSDQLSDIIQLYGNQSWDTNTAYSGGSYSKFFEDFHPWVLDLLREVAELGATIAQNKRWLSVRYSNPFTPIDSSLIPGGITIFSIDSAGFTFAGFTYQMKLLGLEEFAEDYFSRLIDNIPETTVENIPSSGDAVLKRLTAHHIDFERMHQVAADFLSLLTITLSELTAHYDHAIDRFIANGRSPFTEDINRFTNYDPGSSVGHIFRNGHSIHSHPFRPMGNAISDGWTLEDKLGYRSYARAISSFIQNEKTEAPLAIGIHAPWGAGKTSLMRMIQNEIDPLGIKLARDPDYILKQDDTGRLKRADVRKFQEDFEFSAYEDSISSEMKPKWISIWFNPWKYESSDQVWAGLADAIIGQTAARLPQKTREKFLFLLNLARFDAKAFRNSIHLWFINKTTSIVLGSAIALFGVLISPAFWSNIGYYSLFFGPILGILASLGISCWSKILDTKEINIEAEKFIKIPDYDTKLGFRHAAEEDIRKVISTAKTTTKGEYEEPNFLIFIDDLDRCSPKNIAAVFEALNLFISSELPHCYLVIGMDGEVVAAALEESYSKLFESLPEHLKSKGIGWDYLDKFIQIPFVVPPISDARLLSISAYRSGKNLEDTGKFEAQPISTDRSKTQPGVRSNQLNSTTDSNEERETTGDIYNPRKPEEVVEAEENVLSTDDSFVLEQLDQLLPWDFNKNPRTLKRFLNHARMQFLSKFIIEKEQSDLPGDAPIELPDNFTIIRWSYLCSRWPILARWIQAGSRGQEVPLQQDADKIAHIKHRMKLLEEFASNNTYHNTWVQNTSRVMRLPHDELKTSDFRNAPWLNERALFEFFREEAKRDKKLSDFVGHGLW